MWKDSAGKLCGEITNTNFSIRQLLFKQYTSSPNNRQNILSPSPKHNCNLFTQLCLQSKAKWVPTPQPPPTTAQNQKQSPTAVHLSPTSHPTSSSLTPPSTWTATLDSGSLKHLMCISALSYSVPQPVTLSIS